MGGDRIRWQTVAGTPSVAGNATVIPEARILTIRWPHGGLVWTRPVAVRVEREGRSERIPIVDVTRLVEMSLRLAGLATAVMLLWSRQRAARQRRRDADDNE